MRCRRCSPLPEQVARTADLLGRRWSLQIIYAASQSGASRFNEFRQVLVGIPPRTLAQRLVDLEQAGVLERVVVDARPPRVEYRLTRSGGRLAVVMDGLQSWSESH
jgi:DNA-binding HxlR family transcriptional regulator